MGKIIFPERKQATMYWGRGGGSCIGFEFHRGMRNREMGFEDAISIRPINTRGIGNLTIELPVSQIDNFIKELQKLK